MYNLVGAFAGYYHPKNTQESLLTALTLYQVEQLLQKIDPFNQGIASLLVISQNLESNF